MHLAPWQSSQHRGGWRAVTGRALHSLYALARCKTRLILSIYDESRLLQRSAVENRAARTTYSASVAAVSRTEEAPGWVTSGATDVTAEHHMHCGHARFTQQHRSRAVPRPAGHALCMLLPCSPAATCEAELQGYMAEPQRRRISPPMQRAHTRRCRVCARQPNGGIPCRPAFAMYPHRSRTAKFKVLSRKCIIPTYT